MNPLHTAKRHIKNAIAAIELSHNGEALWQLAHALDRIDNAINEQKRMPHVGEIPLLTDRRHWWSKFFRRTA